MWTQIISLEILRISFTLQNRWKLRKIQTPVRLVFMMEWTGLVSNLLKKHSTTVVHCDPNHKSCRHATLEMVILKQEETYKNMKDNFKNGPSVHDLVKDTENELDMNKSPCKHMQFIVIHLLIL